MNGRNGVDQLSLALLWAGVLCYLLGGIIGSVQASVIFPMIGLVFHLFGFAAYVFSSLFQNVLILRIPFGMSRE